MAKTLPELLSRLLDNFYIIPRYLATIIWPPASSMRYYIPDNLHLLALPLVVLCAIILISIW